MITLAVITVVKNHPDGLARTAGSLTGLPGIRLLWYIADGGSTGGIATALPGPRPHWVDSRPDGGIYHGMNRALTRVLADGLAQVVLFLNAGDEIAMPNALITATKIAAKGTLVYGDACEYDHEGRAWLWPARHPRWLRWGMPAHHQAMLYPRAALTGLLFDPAYSVGADYALTLRAASRVPVRYLPVLICRFEGGGLSHRQAVQGRLDQFHIRRRLLGWPAPLAAGLYAVQSLRWRLRQCAWPLFRGLRGLTALMDGSP